MNSVMLSRGETVAACAPDFESHCRNGIAALAYRGALILLRVWVVLGFEHGHQ
jgi:hypothetical protein